MKTCSRVWQAEALEDGRLGDDDKNAFERHAAGCSDCGAERASLRALRERMQQVDTPPASELSRRALRGKILQRASEHEVRAPGRWRWALVATAGLAAGAALAWPRLTRPPSRFEVIDVTQARWHTETSGDTSRVILDAGTALFQVQKLKPSAHFLVRLPDGEIEVRGTRFVVDVQDDHTRSVVVTEGTVALRLGGTESLLHAGERWPAPLASAPSAPSAPPATNGAAPAGSPGASTAATAAPTAPSTATAPPASVGAPSVATRSSSASEGAPTVAMRPLPTSDARAPRPRIEEASAPASAPAATSSAPPVRSPGADFADAMAAFSAGDYGRADTLLAAFGQKFPRDGRAEDALYLRVQCRTRVGDRPGAAALARQYLVSFPRGLRRPEMERLATP